MKKAFLLLISIFIIISCGSRSNRNKEENKPVITVSILPLKTFVEKIAGDDFEVNVLLPPGASPAAFTLVPSQLKKISDSEVWLRIGYIGFEFSWKDKIQQVNQDMKVIDLSEGLDLIRNETLPGVNQGPPAGVNPHTWLSSSLVKQMSKHITEELSKINPDNESVYLTNYRKFAKEIDELDAEIKDALKDYKGEQFITFHPSLSYFAREYGLIQHSLEPGGKEPTPQRMAKLIDFARQEGIRVIYIQSDFDIEQARVFAEEIDGKIEQMWPLNPNWTDNLREITQMLVANF